MKSLFPRAGRTFVRRALVVTALALAGLLASPARSYTLSNNSSDTGTVELFNDLAAEFGNRTLTGTNEYPHTPAIFPETGKVPAVRTWDMHYLLNDEAAVKELVKDYFETRRPISIHWHWRLGGQSAWRAGKGPSDPPRTDTDTANWSNDVLRLALKTGTAQNTALTTDLEDAYDVLQILENAGVPVLFRPLHEIDGGWFWWSQPSIADGADSVALWEKIYQFLAVTKDLDNLIWVWSLGKNVADTSANIARAASFYPGSNRVDIAGVDLYRYSSTVTGGPTVGATIPGTGYHGAALATTHEDQWNLLSAVVGSTEGQPNKLLALPEVAFLHPAGVGLPKWLYALTWFGAPSTEAPYSSSVTHQFTQFWHADYLTADELGASFGPTPSAPYNNGTPTTSDDIPANIRPFVSIRAPFDDGLGLYVESQPPTIQVNANDRDGTIVRVDYYALRNNRAEDYATSGTLIASRTSPPYDFTWTARSPGNPNGWLPGTYTLVAVAEDNAGAKSHSNPFHVTAGVSDVAYGKTPVVSSNPTTADLATNLRYFSTSGTTADAWTSAADAASTIYVDLGTTYKVSEFAAVFGWKQAPTAYKVHVATTNPSVESSWTQVAAPTGLLAPDFKHTTRALFTPTSARYVRFTGVTRRYTWGGYSFASFEVPIPGVTPTADISSQPSYSTNHPEYATLPLSSTTKAALRFDLGAWPSATNATLKVWVVTSAASSATLTVNAATSDTLDESGSATFPGSAVTALDSVTVPASFQGWVDFDVTSFVQPQLASGPDKVVSFVIKSSTAGWVAKINTRNATANLPHLEVTP